MFAISRCHLLHQKNHSASATYWSRNASPLTDGWDSCVLSGQSGHTRLTLQPPLSAFARRSTLRHQGQGVRIRNLNSRESEGITKQFWLSARHFFHAARCRTAHSLEEPCGDNLGAVRDEIGQVHSIHDHTETVLVVTRRLIAANQNHHDSLPAFPPSPRYQHAFEPTRHCPFHL